MIAVASTFVYHRPYGSDSDTRELFNGSYAPSTTWQEVLDDIRLKTVLPVPSSALTITCLVDDSEKAVNAQEKIGDSAHAGVTQLTATVHVNMTNTEDPSIVAMLGQSKRESTQRMGNGEWTDDGARVYTVPEFRYHRAADEVMFRCLLQFIERQRQIGNGQPISLVGSRGVGKTTIARGVAIERSHAANDDVLYVHSTGYFELFTSLHHRIHGPLYQCELSRLIKVLATIEGRHITPYVILDGHPPAAAIGSYQCGLLVSSISPSDSELIEPALLVSSWSLDDILAFDRTNTTSARLGEETTRERFFQFGGDLSSVFGSSEPCGSLDCVGDRITDVLLPDSHWKDLCGANSLRRLRVTDRNDPKSHMNPTRWIAGIEAIHVYRHQLHQISYSWVEQLQVFARDTSVQGLAYELACQFRACHEESLTFTSASSVLCQEDDEQATIASTPPTAVHGDDIINQAAMIQPSLVTGDIVVDTSKAIVEGHGLDQALAAMKQVVNGSATYAAPIFPVFPCIDAVAMCTLYDRDGMNPQQAVALIQYTSGKLKEVNPAEIDTIKKVLDGTINASDAARELNGNKKMKWNESQLSKISKAVMKRILNRITRSGDGSHDSTAMEDRETPIADSANVGPRIQTKVGVLPVVLIYASPPGSKLDVTQAPPGMVVFKATFDSCPDSNQRIDESLEQQFRHILGNQEKSIDSAASN